MSNQEENYQKAFDNIKGAGVDIWSATVIEIVLLDENVAQDIITVLKANAEVVRQAINNLTQDQSRRDADVLVMAKEAKKIEDRINTIQLCRSLIGECSNQHLY